MIIAVGSPESSWIVFQWLGAGSVNSQPSNRQTTSVKQRNPHKRVHVNRKLKKIEKTQCDINFTLPINKHTYGLLLKEGSKY